MTIDLRQLGHDENILYELAHKDEPKYEEAHIVGDLPDIVQKPPPDWLPISKKKSWWKIFNLLVI